MAGIIENERGRTDMKNITINGRDYNVSRVGFRKNMMAIFTASGRGRGRSNHIVYRCNDNTDGEMYNYGFGLTLEQCRKLIVD